MWCVPKLWVILDPLPFFRTSYLDCPTVRPTAEDLELLLSTNDVEPPKQLEEMGEETQRQLAELETGSVALVYERKGEGKREIVDLQLISIWMW